MDTNPDRVQDVVVSFKKAKRVLVRLQFVAAALIIIGALIPRVLGQDSFGQFIGQMAEGVGLGLLLANLVYGLALGLWGKCPPTPVR
jgi:hypothetical protein